MCVWTYTYTHTRSINFAEKMAANESAEVFLAVDLYFLSLGHVTNCRGMCNI